jgi:type IV pilus assembly protein PilQ
MTGTEIIAMNPLSKNLSPRRRVVPVALALAALLAQAADAAQLQSVAVQSVTGQRLELVLNLDGPAPEPVGFSIDNPARISLDLPGTSLALASRRLDVRKAGLDSVLAAEANGRTRVVLNLEHQVPYATRVDGNRIIVTLGDGNSAAAAVAATQAAPAATPPAPAAAVPAGRGLQGLDFRRSPDGTGRIVVQLGDPRMPVNLKQQGNQVVADFPGASLPENLRRRYDVTDFGTPVNSFDAVAAAGGARLVIAAAGDFEQLAYQSDSQFVIEIQPRRAGLAEDPGAAPVYTGERLSLNFQNIETRAVLQLLADASGQNIVVSDSVSGGMALRLQDVPWDQALDIVLRSKGLDKRRHDNVIIVAPADELAAREKADLASRRDMLDLAPLRTEYLQINYAKASDIAALVQAGGGRGAAGDSGKGFGSMLSGRGSVSVDERTNTLLIQDTADSIANVRQLVTTLDIPVRQVLIEARIVVVSDSFSRDLGARAGVTSARARGSNGLVATSATAAGTDGILSSALDNLASSGSPFPIKVPTGSAASNRYNVNLPVVEPAGNLAFMLLGSDFIVDLELSAAQSEGRGEVISSPRIVTANQKEALISQGTEIPYQQSASSGAATIQFKKAVLSLRVTPLITPDNRIVLDLHVTKDSIGDVIVTSGGVNVPAINTSEISNQVIVADGQTVVMGGILETERRETEKKVPYLGDVPVLGNLFKSTGKVNNKDELLIFVTPKILREGVNAY